MMGAVSLMFALLGAVLLCGFGWELGRRAARWLLGLIRQPAVVKVAFSCET